MSHGGYLFEQDPSAPKPALGSKLAALAYGQAAAVVLGFTLLILLTNVVGADFFRGPLLDLYEGWSRHVRPAVGVPLQWVMDLLPDEQRVSVPTVLVDYLLVGMAMILWEGRWLTSYDYKIVPILLLAWPFILFVFWPTSKLLMGTKRGTLDVTWTQWLPPLLYCGIWFAANFFV